MDILKEYRNADYENDMFFDRTTSWPEGLQERLQFEPNLPRAVRRMNSADDIQRYKEHFLGAQRNQGQWFRWRHYLKVLRDDLRHFDTHVLMTKSLLSSLARSKDLEKSLYITASEAEIIHKQAPRVAPRHPRMEEKKLSIVRRENDGDADSLSSVTAITINRVFSAAGISTKMSPQNNSPKTLRSHGASPTDSENSLYITASEAEIMQKPRHRIDETNSSLVRRDNAGDTDSLFSVAGISINSASSVAGISANNTISMSPQKKLLKKFFSEIQQFASKTYKTVEKMSVKPKYCSSCGDYIRSVKTHKNCSQLENLIDNEKPTLTSKLKNTNLARTISMTSVTSGGSGESAVFKNQLPSFAKKGFTRRMFPFIKENS